MIDTKQNALIDIIKMPDDAMIQYKQIKETRSIKQNRLYHGLVKDVTDYLKDAGMTMTTTILHESFKDAFIEGDEILNYCTGEYIEVEKSTTKLNKKEFSKYIDDIQNHLIEKGINVPLRTELHLFLQN